MRKLIAVLAGLAVLAFVNFGIYEREQLLDDGRLVLLRLAPVDPRSLMQGDYMALNFEIANQAFRFGQPPEPSDGHIVVAVDRNNVARFRRLDGQGPLAPDEIRLRYRVRGGQPRFAANAFFFEEGSADAFQNAAFGEFRVGRDGEMILTGMRDRSGRLLP